MATKEEKKAAKKAAAEKKAAEEAAAAEAAANADTENDDEDDDDEEDEDETPATPPTVNDSPDGQTASGSPELGASEDDFEAPVTTVDNLGVKHDTRVRKSDEDSDSGTTPNVFKQLTKALGLKASQLLGFNERTRVAVFNNGGKYQVSKNGKSVKHLAGPPPPADLKLDVVDARSRSPFTGTAAAINSSVHDNESGTALQARRASLERQLREVNARIVSAGE